MTIIYIVAFGEQAKRHGGVKRSSQLVEDFATLGITTLDPRTLRSKWVSTALRHPLQLTQFALQAAYLWAFQGVTARAAGRFVLQSNLIATALKSRGVTGVVIEVSAGLGVLTMRTLQSLGLPYVAVPQNIEFMVPGRNAAKFRSIRDAMQNEVAGYSKAVAVVTISDFDRAILETLSVPAKVYPFYPSDVDARPLVELASCRRAASKAEYLVLGTVNHPPTLRGMESLLEQIQNNPRMRKFVVAGYGTDKLKKYESEKIRVLGPVSSEDLNALFVSCKALVVKQSPTTGFLTRIAECNLAGVPIFILGCYLQATGLDAYGVYRINDLDELPENEVSVIKSFSKPSKKVLQEAVASLQRVIGAVGS